MKLMDFSVSLSRRVSSIQRQLAQFESESWPGMAEADRDRLQLIKEKEALLQELQLIIQQRRPAEDVARLEEERRRLEEEIQCSRATSVQGATERWAGWAGGAGFRRRRSIWQSRSLVTQAATAWRKVEGAGACRPQGVPRARRLPVPITSGRSSRTGWSKEDWGTHHLDPAHSRCRCRVRPPPVFSGQRPGQVSGLQPTGGRRQVVVGSVTTEEPRS